MSGHTVKSLIEGWEKVGYRPGGWKGIRANETSDPVLLAGCYLEWASGDLERAIRQVEANCSGRYIDCPRFSGCDATLALLKSLESQNDNA